MAHQHRLIFQPLRQVFKTYPKITSQCFRQLSSERIVDQAGDRKGFALVTYRAATMLKNMSDNQMYRVLHIYCGGGFYKELGNSPNFSIEGCSDDIDAIKLAK